MILKLWRYAYGGAKVMALRSYLLSPEDYHYLLRARNLEDLVGYLRTTAYGPTLFRLGLAEVRRRGRSQPPPLRQPGPGLSQGAPGVKSGSPVASISCCTGWWRKTSR